MTEGRAVGELDVVASADFDAVACGNASIFTDNVMRDSIGGALSGCNYVVGGK